MKYLKFISIFFIVFSISYISLNKINNKKSSSRPEVSLPNNAYERQQYFVDKRLPKGKEQLSFDFYNKAKSQIKNLRHFSSKQNRFLSPSQSKRKTQSSTWESLGPGNIGGRMRVLRYHPQNHDIIYAAGVSGGIWKSKNGGLSWNAITDEMANINIGALAINQSKPNILYAGTGELYRKTLRPYSSMTGAGIFKTTDDGDTWFRLEATNNDNFLYVSDIVISPHNNKRIYAATNTGVWQSTNGGISFTQSLFPSDGSGNSLYEGCNDLSLRDDVENDWLLVSCASRSIDDRYYLPGLLPTACNGQPCDARIYINTKAEENNDWQIALTEPGMGRTQMSIHKANQNIIYASSANTDDGPDLDGDSFPDLANGLHAIFRSEDGGLTWQATLRNTDSTILNTQLFSYAEGALADVCGKNKFYYSAGWYNQAIVVNPINPEIVWVAGMEIYRSNDGGQNFGLASHWDAIYEQDPSVHGAYVHADQHSLQFHPDYDGINNKTLVTTNDGGIYYTQDDSKPAQYGTNAPCYPSSNGTQWSNLNNNLTVTQFYSGAVYNNGDAYIAGAQDNGTNYGSDQRGNNGWVEILGGDGSELAINHEDQRNIYVSSQNARIYRSNSDGTWSYVSEGLTGRYIFITPFIIDENETNRLFLGGDYLWRSNNRGDEWRKISPKLGNNYNDLISALAIAPGNSSRILFANQSKIHLKTNALSDTLTTIESSSSPREGWVSSLAFEPANENVAYATYSTFGGVHVWKSSDGGKSWDPLDGTGTGVLPDIPVHSIVVDPTNSQRLFIGTDLGVFVSVDGGQHWLVENTGFSQVITERLVINKPDTNAPLYLFAFTYGRGAWRVPLSDLDALPNYEINSEISGLWYQPEQSGHGLQIEVFTQDNQDKLFVSWYVHHNGEPIWLTGIGEINTNSSLINLIITGNTGFPIDNFNSQDVQRSPWGSISLEFSDNNTGKMSWSSNLDGFSNGSLAIQKLTHISNNLKAEGINACHSGSWYNTDQSGHGFMLEVLDSDDDLRMIATWFTYYQGQQYWILADGLINGSSAILSAKSYNGGDFPPDFDSSNINQIDWGEITFTIIDNNNAIIGWQSPLPEFGDGEITVSRLTQLSQKTCLK